MDAASWKSYAAGTFAKRNLMLSEQRMGAGMPPRAQSTSILDPSAYSARGNASSLHVFDDEDVYERAKIVSPAFPQPSSFSPRDDPAEVQMPWNEGGRSSLRDRESALSPMPLKAMPPQRVQPSRVHGTTLHKQEHHPNMQLLHHLPPRVVARSSQVLEPYDQPPSYPNTASFAHHAPQILTAQASSAYASESASEYPEHDTTADSPDNASPANEVVNSSNVMVRIPTINPYIPNPVKMKSPNVDLVFDDSESEDDVEKSRVSKSPELSAEEKLNIDVLRQQFDHLVEAVKSKKLTGAVKIAHGMNALRLALHLHATHAQVDNALSDLQAVLYKLAWDYHSLFFEAETFRTLVDVFIDGRSILCSKLALQVLLVFFERDVRINGGAVRSEFFDGLSDVIASCLQSEDAEFQLEWGLWFVSYVWL